MRVGGYHCLNCQMRFRNNFCADAKVANIAQELIPLGAQDKKRAFN